jgi:hypothetical protein
MTFTGIIKSLSNGSITLFTEDDISEAVDLIDYKLTISIIKHRAKRSLDANNYAWQLMTEIAKIIKSSKEAVYELMLQRYGANAIDEDGNIILVTAKAGFNNVDIHCAYYDTQYTSDGEIYRYRLIKGSSLYDTLEMSQLIDGIVSEAQDIGIQTATPDEIRMMKERWGV